MTDFPVADPLGPQNSVSVPDSTGVFCHAGQDIVQAQHTGALYRLVDGWAFGARMLEDGRRQIVSFLLPGDLVNAPALLGGHDGTPLLAMTDVRVAVDEAADAGHALPALLAHMAWQAEHVVSLGRRTAYERIAAFLLQIGERLDGTGETARQRYHVPLRLEHLADHLGLSVVHVSRTMRQLRGNGLASLYRGELELGDRAALARLSEYRAPRFGIAADLARRGDGGPQPGV